MAVWTLDEPRSYRARAILRLAAENPPRTVRELAEAAGVTRQYAHKVLARYAPQLRTRGVAPRVVTFAVCAWCGERFAKPKPTSAFCSMR